MSFRQSRDPSTLKDKRTSVTTEKSLKSLQTQNTFQHLSKEEEQKQLGSAIQLLRNFGFMRHFTRITLSKVRHHVKKVDFAKDSVVIRQGDPFTHFYLILNGEFEQLWEDHTCSGEEMKPVTKSSKQNFLINKNQIVGGPNSA